MPESYTPKEINDYINSHNKGPKFDPYGSEELSNRLRTNKAEAGDIFAQAEQTLDEEDKASEKAKALAAEQAKQAEIDKAQQALLEFRNYLAQSTGPAAFALPSDSELAYNYNPDTQKCEITRLDGEPIVLDISDSELNGELPLPPQLMVTSLICYNNQLTTLPELPTSMTELYCSNNQLTTLPEVLPTSLTTLHCAFNQLTSLPEVLPTSLTTLHCANNLLTSLPEVLPASLTELDCYSNRLTTLPEVLPTSLTKLDCSNNQLTTLPEVLPTSLTVLDCSNNQLTSLPELPASLRGLWCQNNQLTSLPELPASLRGLHCSSNPDLANNPAAQAALKELRDRGATVSS